MQRIERGRSKWYREKAQKDETSKKASRELQQGFNFHNLQPFH